MNRKKLLSVVLALTAFALPFSISASGEGKPTETLSENYQSVLLYNEILADMENTKQSRSNTSPVNGYAGAYIDEEDHLNVLLTEEAPAAFKDSISGKDDSIILQKADFTFDYLSENLNIIRNNPDVLSDSTAYSNYIDESENRIILYMEDTSEENINKIKALEGLDGDTLLFIEKENTASRYSTTDASAGNMVNNGVSAVTVAFGCKLNGYDGFVTVGHGLSNSNSIYKGGTSQSNKVGTVYKRILNTTMDASFVKSEGNKYPALKVLTNGFYGGVNQKLKIPEGTAVKKIGGISGNKYGTVTGNDIEIDFGDGVGLSKGFTATNIATVSGDSGAPIMNRQNNTDNGGYVLEGMVIGGNGSTTYMYTYLRIKNALGVSMSEYMD